MTDDVCVSACCSQIKKGIYLLQDGNEEPFSIRLHLAKDILTIQEQDIICVSGEPFYSSVGSVLESECCLLPMNALLLIPLVRLVCVVVQLSKSETVVWRL